jgi:hypothetical protein
MNKPKLKLDFTDFGGLNKVDNWFTRVLARDFEIEISDRPDLLIFQEGSHLNRLYTCKKLFWTGESIFPDWTRTDYAMTCHYLDNPRHLRVPYYVLGCEASTVDLTKRADEVDAIVSQNRGFCATVISNGNPKRAGERIRFFQKLHAQKPVASGGRFMNNVGDIGLGGQAKHRFISQYKFNLCYENKSLPGYTTEKLTEAMWARCIPIYWGNERVGEEFNKKSFLYRGDYASDEAFIERIMEVDRDEDLYRAILEEPYFHNNVPNEFFSEDRVLEFFHRILDDDKKPVSHEKRFWQISRWMLAKRQHLR